jgi:hypothetical protein
MIPARRWRAWKEFPRREGMLMVELALAGINSFASPAPQVDFIQALLGELQALREEVARLQEDNQDLREKVATQECRLDNHTERLQNHGGRLIELEMDKEEIAVKVAPKEPAAKASPHIDELYNHMKLVGLKQTTFAGAAKILKVTKQRVLQLKPDLAQDMRFIILPSQSHSQKLIIRLRECQEL